MLDFDYNQSLSVVKGVGSKILAKLAKCDLYTFKDILFYFPIRYEDKTKITPITELRDGEFCVIEGIISKIYNVKKNVLVELKDPSDDSSVVRLIFFHLHPVQRKDFKINSVLRCYGSVRFERNHCSMMHPDVQCITEDAPALEQYLTPVYSVTQGLHQSILRKIIGQVLECFVKKYGHTKTASALLFMHHPAANTHSDSIVTRQHSVCQYLIVQELSNQLCNLRKLKSESQVDCAVKIELTATTQANIATFFKNCPFSFTTAQHRVIEEIMQDFSSDKVMMRLVQGDVGSGKTMVAALSALIALSDSKQVALMAPTELLALQLFQNFSQWLDPFGFESIWLCGSMSAKEKKQALGRLLENKPLIAIGTHALFQKAVQFNNLAFIIIDEQHRFGVHQRFALMSKNTDSQQVHQLIMTATPIPRTLAMTQYANLDISVINELPVGRKAIKTIVMSEPRRSEIIQKMRALCQAGQQVYWVCTVIDESQDYQAATQSFSLLQLECRNARIGLIHGRMSMQEKEITMKAFKAGELQVLVATTVIEVGVDVPNATLMVIENPERLGLAQLHQLRGRVGRGVLQSFCILLYKLPLQEKAKARLEVLRSSQDGFFIAEKDLELRGCGEIIGAKQSGGTNFKILDLVRDKELITHYAKMTKEHTPELPELFDSIQEYTQLQSVG